jgi:hypothetical protein
MPWRQFRCGVHATVNNVVDFLAAGITRTASPWRARFWPAGQLMLPGPQRCKNILVCLDVSVMVFDRLVEIFAEIGVVLPTFTPFVGAKPIAEFDMMLDGIFQAPDAFFECHDNLPYLRRGI